MLLVTHIFFYLTLVSILVYVASDEQMEMCKQFAVRKYLPRPNLERMPPLLYTMPGSGNTWCRLLIEYSTGVLSGSVYNDPTLKTLFPGEFFCNTRESVIKIHPHTHPWERVKKSIYIISDRNKCKDGQVKINNKSIHLVRDPFSAIFSEYQRLWTRSHTGIISESRFNTSSWERAAARLAHAFNDMMKKDYTGIEEFLGKKNVLYVKYEDLKNTTTRVDTLRKIVEYVGIWTKDTDQKDERLECAFVNAAKIRVKRPDTEEKRVTAASAYKKAPHLICSMWALFGDSASKLGYDLPSYAPHECDRTKDKPIVDNPHGLRVFFDPNKKTKAKPRQVGNRRVPLKPKKPKIKPSKKIRQLIQNHQNKERNDSKL